MKTRSRRALGLLLAVLLPALALSGCGLSAQTLDELLYGQTEEPRLSPEPVEYIIPLAQGDWLDEVYRPDVDYADMADIAAQAELGPKLERLLEFCRGGEDWELSEAYLEAADELGLVYTRYSLADIAYCAGPTEETEAALDSARQAWQQALLDFYNVMGELALSNAQLLDEALGEGVAENFAGYAGMESWGGDAGAQEQLLYSYHQLMQSPQPDEQAAAELFVQLVELRNAEAREAGWSSYAEQCYYEDYYRAYSPQDAASVVWPAVKEYCAPLLGLYEEAAADALWTLYYESGLDCSEERVLEVLDYVAPRLSRDAAEALDYMLAHGLYDIGPSPTKLDTGFTAYLYYFNVPFLFNSPYGDVDDFSDSFHEFGHYLNGYGTVSDLVFGMPDMDLSELQAQGMEIMFTHWYEDVFGGYADEMLLATLWDMLDSVVEGSLYDEFQQRCYAEPDLTAERACELYLETAAGYGLEPGKYDWLYIPHNFDDPFYYISYCLSALPALELYGILQEEPETAATLYMRAVSLDPELYYFDEALEECGFSDVFDAESYAACARQLEPEFERLSS